MDSTAVKRGLTNIRAGFVRLGGVVRGIGGAMRKAFIPAAAAAGALAIAFKKVADEGSELSDMAMQTGVSVEKLVIMQEALRRAGAPIRDTSRMLSMLASNVKEARFEAGPAREALDDLGISLSDISGKRLDEQFMMILERIRDAGDQVQNLEGAMEGLFGARMGFGILRLAKDLDVNMQRAAESAKSHAKFMDENADKLDRTADELGRLGMIFKTTVGKLLINLPWDKINDFLAGLNDLDFSAQIESVMAFFREEKWKDWANGIGKAIAEGIKSNLGKLGGFMFGGETSFNMNRTAPRGTNSQKPVNDLLNETKGTNRLLESIMLREGATFA